VVPTELTGHTLVLYDGVCGLCNRLVRFLLRFDHRDRFRYAAIQSEFAAGVLRKHGLDPAELSSVVLVTDFGRPTEKAYTKSDAILAASRDLGGFWRPGTTFGLLPRAIRDRLYEFVAKNRYRWFGRYEVCPIPKPEHRVKFVHHVE